ncbi:tRNA 2-selenouridine(34) synthase MnmH [Lyngbya sp. CCY1209]|uniref:tRNA 2-selenouridine(34) synthase MnmH n=1 Tax=Lyngbya sp. CCY1209 TaxID=2886103 RepID=UPI002D207206|nr:tRNA 2-selenouridine(34) synthase MnmH [Lyngbya sp. CCY1209]MEB3884208.1 tRNA 2-selenouridine(34) synthase MnmH [Lyngbya sp. CCY1209]
MAQSLNPDRFLQAPGPILDVRSPGEYAQGHIPEAIAFPLFTDAERAKVGICYKHEGRDRAVELGFAIAGPKFAGFIAAARDLAPDGQIRMYCWRGGMRSGGVSWVLEMGGFRVSLLAGGYKAFRGWGRAQFQTPKKIVILGGMTGTGKTDVLHALAAQGEQILDLEGLARHRGSSYGSLGQPPQPTNEQFWNQIAIAWAGFDPERRVWIEAESKRIGLCRVPEELYQQMDRAPVIQIERPRHERLELLVEAYGEAEIEKLIGATERIRKRLGGARTREAIAFLERGKLAEAFDLILYYYDKTYSYDLERRQVPLHGVDVAGCSPDEAATRLLQKARAIWE